MSASTDTLILINRAAARARRAWPHIKRTLEAARIPFDAHETTHRGDAETRARAALSEGYQTIAVVGGDGTLSETAAGFFESPGIIKDAPPPQRISPASSLAVLPAGTGDDFARGLMKRRAPLEEWLEKLIAHCRRGAEKSTTRTVDVLYGTVDDGAHRFICLNAATLGIGAEVVGSVAAQRGSVRRLSGEARFALAAVGALAAWRARRVSVAVDEDYTAECPTNLIAILNGPYAGSGMHFSPGARSDDGLLDVVTTCGISRAIIMRELTRIHRGGHLANPKVRVVRGARVRIESLTPADALALEADGDVRGRTPAEFRVMPGALRVVF